MSAQLQLRREASSFVATFIGALGEIIADTTNNRLVLQDAATAGGWPAAKLVEVIVNSAANNIIAHSGGSQANATVLAATFNQIATVAAAGDSCRLGPSTPGALVVIVNSGSNAAQLFGDGSDTINGIAGTTGISLAAGKILILFCIAAGIWLGGYLSAS